MSRGKTGESSASPGGTEAIVWNRCSYQVPEMVGTNSSTNEKHKFYNSIVQDVSRRRVYCARKVGSLCSRFVDMGSPVKTQVKNGLSKIFDFGGQNIDVYKQAAFILKGFRLHDEEGNETNTSNLLTAS